MLSAYVACEMVFTFYGVRTVHKSGTGDHKTMVFAPGVYLGGRKLVAPASLGVSQRMQRVRAGGVPTNRCLLRVSRGRTMGTHKTLRHFGVWIPKTLERNGG